MTRDHSGSLCFYIIFRIAFSKFVMNVTGIWETTLKSHVADGDINSFNLRTHNVFLSFRIFNFFLQGLVTFVSKLFHFFHTLFLRCVHTRMCVRFEDRTTSDFSANYQYVENQLIAVV